MLVQIGTNSKLGNRVGATSLPALVTCPGKTSYCSKVCYATKGFFRFNRVGKSLADNFEAAQQNDFVVKVRKEITRTRVTAFRIHPSGDFYSNEYIQKWIDIITGAPSVKFWAYTRSWRVPELVNKLQELNKLPNLQLFASIDATTIETPPTWLRVADVTNNWDTYDSTYVRCPNQKNDAITCEKCTYCFKEAKGLKQNVVFTEH